MPYIRPDNRIKILPLAYNLGAEIGDAGELNYAITMTILKYLSCNQNNYATLNTIIGALECVKQEFYRRVVVPYEEKKQLANGDVY